MTQLPFGGLEADEEPLDESTNLDAFREELLRELRDAPVLRPAYRRWMYYALLEQRLVLQRGAGASGVPRHVTNAAVELAAAKIVERVPGWTGTPYFGWAITQAMTELGLNVDLTTFRGWIRDYRDAKKQGQADIREALADEATEAANALFETLAAQDTDAAKALRVVTFYLQDNGLPVDDDELVMLRDMAYGSRT
jgi:hypothetical protein